MRFRSEKPEYSDAEELKRLQGIRELAGVEPAQRSPSDQFWPNQLVYMNARIDEASSGKAISLSWAARVAIPGVVAIVSFLVGLQYYVPRHEHDLRVASVLEASAGQNIDTVLSAAGQTAGGVMEEEIASSYMDVSDEQLSEYLISNGRTTDVMEVMSDQQVNTVLTSLGNTR